MCEFCLIAVAQMEETWNILYFVLVLKESLFFKCSTVILLETRIRDMKGWVCTLQSIGEDKEWLDNMIQKTSLSREGTGHWVTE